MTVEKPVEKRFIFSGSAVAFGGRLRRPEQVFLKSVAPSHLPVTGGLSEATVKVEDADQYHYKPFFRFTSASSRALGDFSDTQKAIEFTHGNHGQNDLAVHTIVEAGLQGLNLEAPADAAAGTPKRVFHAVDLATHMESVTNRRPDSATLRSLTVTFKGISLTTDDKPAFQLNVETNTQIFCDNDSKAKLMKKYADDGDFRKKYAACFHPLGEEKSILSRIVGGSKDIPHAEDGPIVATVVTKLSWMGDVVPPGTEILGNRLTVPGLGRIYFGEIIIADNYQRITLLRFELGSQNGGCASACESSSNGTHYPPLS